MSLAAQITPLPAPLLYPAVLRPEYLPCRHCRGRGETSDWWQPADPVMCRMCDGTGSSRFHRFVVTPPPSPVWGLPTRLATTADIRALLEMTA